MGTIRVWTKQNIAVLEALNTDRRYTARREGVLHSEDAQLMLSLYSWLARSMPQRFRPADADFPVWTSLNEDNTMLPSPDFCILELEVEEELLCRINVAKWGMITNFSYLPLDEADARRHEKKMEAMGISDARACMTLFYPTQRREIENSWQRLFDDRIQVGSPYCYGLLWEVKAEWVRSIKR